MSCFVKNKIYILLLVGMSSLCGIEQGQRESNNNQGLTKNVYANKSIDAIELARRDESKEEESGLTLMDLLQNAKSNLNLEAKDIAILQAKANKFAAKASYLPVLTGNYQLQNIDNTYRRQQTQAASLRAEWEIFSGFRSINQDREKTALYKASIADRQNAQEQLFLNIIEQYYLYFTYKAQMTSLEQKHKQLDVDMHRVERLYEAGLTTIDDVESLKAEMLTTEHDISSKTLDMEQIRLVLSLLSNTNVEKLKRVNIAKPSYGMKTRADIVVLEEQIKSSRAQAKQAAPYWPTISIFDTFGWNQFDRGFYFTKPALTELLGTTSGSFSSPNFQLMSFPQYQNVIGINVSMKIFDFFQGYKQQEGLKYAVLQKEKELAYKKHQQEQDEKLYRKSLDISEAKIKSAEAALKSASISFENVSKRYDAQILNFADYLLSLSKRFDAEASYSQSLNDYEVQKARYIYNSGQNIEDYIK